MKNLIEHIDNMPTCAATCDRHGTYTSRNYLGNVWSRCPTCAGEEARATEEREKAERAERRVRAWREALGHSQIPERFRDRTLDSYIAKGEGQKRALAFAQEYAASFEKARGRSAIFVGTPGTGKTHLAIGIALEIMRDHRHTALFYTVMRAIRRVKETWNRNSKETESQAIGALTYPSLLILDEIGVQHGSETEKTILFDVLNERYEQRRPSILLSNLPLDEVRQYLGDRVFDRLREGGGEAVVFDWASHRGDAI